MSNLQNERVWEMLAEMAEEQKQAVKVGGEADDDPSRFAYESGFPADEEGGK